MANAGSRDRLSSDYELPAFRNPICEFGMIIRRLLQEAILKKQAVVVPTFRNNILPPSSGLQRG